MCPARVDNKYCIPIIKPHRSEVQEILENHIDKFRFAEIWLDYITDLDPGFVTTLVGMYPNRLIMVFRRQNMEPMKMPPADRFKLIESLAKKQVLVDMDVSLQADEIARLQSDRVAVKTILSYHNYSFTPSDTELRSITDRMQGWGAHVAKVSTFCNTQRDALRLLSLLIDLREAGQRCIVLGMGKHGVVTRIFGTVWGNEMAFTPIESTNRSAPGQLTLDKMDSIMQALG